MVHTSSWKGVYVYVINKEWYKEKSYQRIRAMTYTFFNQKVDNDVNEGLNWFRIKLIVSFQDITQNMVCNLAKISHPADLEICKFNLEPVIELYWWHVKCLLLNKLLKIVP